MDSVPVYKKLLEAGEKQKIWTQPDILDLNDPVAESELRQRMALNKIHAVIDPIESISNDLFELRHPADRHDEHKRNLFIQSMKDMGPSYGSWVHFPWNGNVVRYPEKSDHQRLRTFRNQHLIKTDEQESLLRTTVAVFGMSVGSNVVEQLAQGGIGGKYILGDYDLLSPSNLNRVRSSMAMAGAPKTDIMGMRISEIDPYIEQVHFKSGLSEENVEMLVSQKPDIIFDEIDDFAAKALLRQIAIDMHTPLVMVTDVADRSIVDIERHDKKGSKPFNGRLSQKEYEMLLNGVSEQNNVKRMQSRLVGISNASTRLIQSIVDIDKNLAGLPQLGTTAGMGGALGAISAREILLDNKLESGRYVFSAKDMFGLHASGTFADAIRAAHNFMTK